MVNATLITPRALKDFSLMCSYCKRSFSPFRRYMKGNTDFANFIYKQNVEIMILDNVLSELPDTNVQV